MQFFSAWMWNHTSFAQKWLKKGEWYWVNVANEQKNNKGKMKSSLITERYRAMQNVRKSWWSASEQIRYTTQMCVSASTTVYYPIVCRKFAMYSAVLNCKKKRVIVTAILSIELLMTTNDDDDNGNDDDDERYCHQASEHILVISHKNDRILWCAILVQHSRRSLNEERACAHTTMQKRRLGNNAFNTRSTSVYYIV